MDHKKYQNGYQEWELTPPQKEQAQDLMLGAGENASLMAIEAQLEESLSALQGIRSIQRRGTGDATLPVQGLQEDLQRSNRHSVAGPS